MLLNILSLAGIQNVKHYKSITSTRALLFFHKIFQVLAKRCYNPEEAIKAGNWEETMKTESQKLTEQQWMWGTEKKLARYKATKYDCMKTDFKQQIFISVAF